MRKRFIVYLIMFLIISQLIMGVEVNERSFINNLEVAFNSPLSSTRLMYAQCFFIYCYIKLGYERDIKELSIKKAVQDMTENEYVFAIEKTAIFCKSPELFDAMKQRKTSQEDIEKVVTEIGQKILINLPRK
jgi:hypothetical protein